MRHARRWIWSLAAGATLLLAGLLTQLRPPAEAPPVAAAPTPAGASTGSSGWSLLALGGGGEAPRADAPALRPARTPEDLLHALFTDGSLRGAALDGDWGRWDGQRLAPSADLRRRFDQLLTTLGESSAEELRQLVGWLADQDLGPSGAVAVLEVWDRYLRLQQHSYREAMDLQQPQRWPLVLQERQRVRRDALGSDWAEAFYGAEERAFGQRLQGAPQAEPQRADHWLGAAPAGTDAQTWQRQRVAALGEAAAARLEAEERRQADWQTRIDAARAELDRMKRAPELSAPQRQAAVTQWLETHFEGTERLRARALLGL